MILYLSALRKGEYVNNLIRVMVVGHFGVGKTTLVKGLLQQDPRGTRSTDGIEVHIRKCLYNKDTGKWHVQGNIEFLFKLFLCVFYMSWPKRKGGLVAFLT